MRLRRRSFERLLVLAVMIGMLATTVPQSPRRGAAFAQSSTPSISLSQSRGLVGRSITVTGSGFGGDERVDIRWRSASSTPIASPQASSSGAFSASIALPDAPNGAQTVYATGRQTARQATATYTVERPAGQSSRISEGVYSVYATRIGLIGNSTSSGHVIREGDFFVALPACTHTNCPGGPYWGNMTNCGNKCYVKIVNPQTNACRVEPILDVGPWFRVDDWWNPTGQRYLNTLPSNPSDLVQGYTGSQAARDGYNVGYGVGPSGIGYDDTGSQGTRPLRQVGNRAAIDLADGTWRSLNLASDGTGAPIRVELLWQTGADPASQSQACGHPVNQTPATNSPGVSNPSFAGAPLQPVSSSQSSNGSGASAVHDGNLQTSWSTTNANPTSGQFIIDYGETQSISGIRWNFSQFGYADRMVVETSTNGSTWSAVGVFGNANAGEWRGAAVSRQGRYVRFSFTNPNRDARLGQVAEIEVWGTSGSMATPTPTPAPIAGSNPQLTGSPLPITGSSQSPNSTSATRAYDQDLGTSWFTTSVDIPGTSMATFDLGRVQQLSGVRWMYRLSGGADRMRLQVSSDGTSWSQLVTTSNRVPLTWEGWRTTTSARYVRFVFDNPHGVAVLGYLAEVEIWGTPSAQTPTPTPRPFPTPSPSPSPSPSPTQSPTPTPSPTRTPGTTPTVAPSPTTAADRYGVVANTGGARLNCRATASTSGAIITSLPEGTRLLLRGPASNGWYPVVCGNRNGWVSGTYLQLESGSPAPTPPTVTPTTTPVTSVPMTVGYIANSGGARVNCRLQPSTAGAIITSLPEGTRVDLRGSAQGGWQPVRCANRDGYVFAQYISTAPQPVTPTPVPVTPAPTPTPGPVTPTASPVTPAPTTTPGVRGTGYVANTGGNRINCRTQPTTSSAVITALAEGTMIDLRGAPVNGWQGVRCANTDGFVAAQFVSSQPPAPPPPVTVEPDPTEPPAPTQPPSAMVGSNPQFSGSPLRITDVWGTNGGNNAWRSIDGSQETSWVSADGAVQAILTLNLGSVQSLTGVRWMYLQSGGADSMRLQVSADGSNWTQLVTTSNRAPYTWEGWPTEVSAQYVRLVFDNPNGVSTLGYVAEVQVWGTGSASDSASQWAMADVHYWLGHEVARHRAGVRQSFTRPKGRGGGGRNLGIPR